MAEQTFEPAYLSLLQGNRLLQRAEQAYEHMRDCYLYARYCHVNRYETIKGVVCCTGIRAVANSYGAHHGEENNRGQTTVTEVRFQVISRGLSS